MLSLILFTLIAATISFEVPYEIVESQSKGKFVVAKRDILPGELVLEEKEPLLYCTEEPVNQRGIFMPREVAFFSAAFSAFKKLPAFQKSRVEHLYAPMDRPITVALHTMASNMRYAIPGVAEPLPFSRDDVDIFVKVSTLMRFNSFSNEEGGCYLFGDMSRFAHSCAANCAYKIVGPTCQCYAIVPISAGEELTISYKEGRDFEPIYERRARYAGGKEFTCHCPRCDAIGDDTRQFDCVVPACKGVMMVHQPLSNEPVTEHRYSYEGVEYVEPHLLPCTVCHRAAPADYQAKMLALEKKLPALTRIVTNKMYHYINDWNTPVESWESLLREIDRYKLPRRHMMVGTILQAKVTVLDNIHRLRGAGVVEKKRRAALECLEAVQNVFPHPRRKIVELINVACKMCGTLAPKPVFSLEEEKALRQKALRMDLIIHGRDKRDTEADNALAKVLSQLPLPQQQPQKQNNNLDICCAFCEESSLRAAMKRSRCGKCKQVAYCSVGCQKAHWKVHKKCCTPNATNQ